MTKNDSCIDFKFHDSVITGYKNLEEAFAAAQIKFVEQQKDIFCHDICDVFMKNNVNNIVVIYSPALIIIKHNETFYYSISPEQKKGFEFLFSATTYDEYKDELEKILHVHFTGTIPNAYHSEPINLPIAN